MAKKWSDVAASSAFQALSLDEREEARQQYFNEVIAPQIPSEDRELAYGQFLSTTDLEPPKGSAPDTGDDMARMLARNPAPKQPGLIDRAVAHARDVAGDLVSAIPGMAGGKFEYKSVMEGYQQSPEELQADAAKRLSYGAGPISKKTEAAADMVRSGQSAPANRVVKKTAEGMDRVGAKSTSEMLSRAASPEAQRAVREWKADDFRTVGEWAVDTVSGLSQGAVGLVQLPVNIIAPSSGVAEILRETQKDLQAAESDVLKANRERLKERVLSEDSFLDRYIATAKELATNPTLSVSEFAKQLPNFLGVVGAARAARAATAGAFNVAERLSPTLALGEAISGGAIRSAATAAANTAGGVGASMVMAGGDAAGGTYEALTSQDPKVLDAWKKNPDYQRLLANKIESGMGRKDASREAIEELATTKARMAALITAPLGLLGYMGAEASIASRGLGRAAADAMTAKGAAKTVAKDILGENLEEGGTQLGSNVITKTISPNQSLTEGVPEAMATATVTSAPLSVLGARSQYKEAAQVPARDRFAEGTATYLLDPQSYDPALMSPAQTVRQAGDIGPSAPARSGVANFTPADSPSAQAGLAPIIVPTSAQQEAPDVGTTGGAGATTPVGGLAGGDQLGGGVGTAGPGVTVPAGNAGDAGVPAANAGQDVAAGGGAGQRSAGLTRPFDRATDATLLARTEQALAGQQNNNANIQPVTIWTGRAGDGYATIEDAQAGLATRVKREPDLRWEVEQMPSGKYRLAGYEQNVQAPAETSTATTARGGLPAAGSTAGAVEASGLTSTNQETARGPQAAQAIQAEAQGQEAPVAAAAAPLTAAQFAQDPAGAIASAQQISFAPGQLAAVKVSDRKKLAAAFDIQEMDDGTTLFTRQPAPQGQALDQQAAGAVATPAPGAAGALPGQGAAPQAPAGAAQAGGVDTATLTSDLQTLQDAHLKRIGKPVKLEVVSPQDSDTGLAASVARVFKAPITFVRAKSGQLRFNGVQLNGRLYVNEAGESAPVAVAMHEVGHTLPQDIKQKMIDGVMATVTPEQRSRFLSEFSGYAQDTKERQDEELVMRIIEQDAQNPEFWQKLADRMGNSDFARLAREILKTLDRIISGFQRENSSEFTTDIKKVRELVADAYAEAQERIDSSAQTDQSTVMPSEARASKEAEGDRQRVGKVDTHVLNVARGERVTADRTQLSAAEKEAVRSAAKKMKKPISEVEDMVRDAKAAHPVQDGWAPLTFTGAKVNEDTGKFDLQYQVIPYDFNVGSNGKSLTPSSAGYTGKVAVMAQAMLREVRTVFQRAQSGDDAAKRIIAQSGWYKEMRTRLRQEFGGLGDLFADLLGATSPNTPVRTNWDNSIEALRLATSGAFDDLLPRWIAWSDGVQKAELRFRAFFDAKLKDGLKKNAIKALPEYKQLQAETRAAREFPDDMLPVKSNGKKFGFNGQNVARAMVDLWRVVQNSDPDIGRGGTAPKAINFSGNLIGFRSRATIDVWAARMLQRLAGGLRIPSMAEGGVSGEALEDGRNTLQFGFGQDVFTDAVKLIRNDAELSESDVLRTINDDDLQALVWFIEKEVWTKGNWTSAAGEGGSFEFESDLAGVADKERVRELRKVADSSVASTQEQRDRAEAEIVRLRGEMDAMVSAQQAVLDRNAEAMSADKVAAKGEKLTKDRKEEIKRENAAARNEMKKVKAGKAYKALESELNKSKAVLKKPTQEQRQEMRAGAVTELGKMARTVDRYTLGLSIQKGAEQGMEPTPPTDAEMADLAQTIVDAAVAGDNGATIVAVKAASTEGRYGTPERSLDFELITNEKFDARPLAAAVFSAAQKADQDSAFVARVLRPSEKFDPLVHRPGIEIYFRDMNQAQEAARIMAETVAMRVNKPLDVGPGFFAVGGYTVIVDGRPTAETKAGKMGKPVGMRVIYMPEFEARYGIDERLKDATEDNIRDIVNERADDLGDFADAILRKFDGVSFAGRFNYEVDARFAGEYEGAINAYSGTTTTARADQGRSQAWQGRPIRESIAAAVGRLPFDGSQPGAAIPGGDGEQARFSEQRTRPDAAGNRLDRELGQANLQGQVTPSYGTPRDGATSAVGYHYSTQSRRSLSSQKFGSGLKGAEMERLQGADPRLLHRTYFYIDRGTGINPEAGVGGYAHRVSLENLYDADEDALRLARDNRSFNNFESAVIDAGFDGYMIRNAGPSGNAVLLGKHTVPVEQLGSRGRMTGEVVPAARARTLSETEKITANKMLPAGSLTGKRWAEILGRGMPEVLENFAGNPVWSSDRRFYKDELARELAQSVPAFSMQRDLNPVDEEARAIFEDLQDARGLKLVRAKEAAAAHTNGEQILKIHNDFFDILEQLDDAGLIKINC